MQFLETVGNLIGWFHGLRIVLLAVPMILVLYLVFGRKGELGRNALGNSTATILFAAINYGATLLFFRDINHGLQAAYAALHVPTLPAGTWSVLPLWLVSVIGLVLKDFVDYWTHRLMHTPWVWPVHAAHHSDTHVNAFTTYRIHVLESTLMTASYIVLLSWLQMPQAIPVVATLSLVHNMYVHMDLPWTHGRFRYLLASPVYHRWHHADVPEAYGKNLANIVPAWDVLFGTYYVPGPCAAPLGGLSSGLADKNPVRIWIYPFQEWGRLIAERAGAVRGTQAAAAPSPQPMPHSSLAIKEPS